MPAFDSFTRNRRSDEAPAAGGMACGPGDRTAMGGAHASVIAEPGAVNEPRLEAGRRLRCGLFFLMGLLLAGPATGRELAEWVRAFNADDRGLQGWIPNEEALSFLEKNVPRFHCPDTELERTYYFRWWTYRKHVRKTEEGFVVTEFLPEVPWARRHNTINCPAGHHFREGRWLHDRKILSDYARFYFGGGGKPRQYSFWAADSILRFCQVTGDHALGLELLDPLVENYRAWEKGRLCDDGLFWQIDDRDGMEASIGGTGKRPTINSYMCGDAKAIAILAGMADRGELQREFAARAGELKRLINQRLWCAEHEFFKTIPYAPQHRQGLHRGATCDFGPWVDVRELHGYTPWYFHIPEPGSSHQAAWEQLMDPRGFRAPYGPTTAEQRHPRFRLSYEGHECQWNGPSWPFATSVTLTAMAHLLQDYPGPLPVGRDDYLEVLRSYARSQRRETEDGREVCWIDENLHPHNGDWIARTRLIQKREEARKSGRKMDPGKKIEERGKDYNHSTFCDLVISGLMGLQTRCDDELRIRPLIPREEWDWCLLEDILYHGHRLTLQWDRDGTKFGRGKGFRVYADGRLLGAEDGLEDMTLKLP
jgi:hypothetical protein